MSMVNLKGRLGEVTFRDGAVRAVIKRVVQCIPARVEVRGGQEFHAAATEISVASELEIRLTHTEGQALLERVATDDDEVRIIVDLDPPKEEPCKTTSPSHPYR